MTGHDTQRGEQLHGRTKTSLRQTKQENAKTKFKAEQD